jgi:WD40 repeat protein
MSVAILEMPVPAARASRTTPATGHTQASHLDPHNPWPGLAAYDEASQAYFHGRDDDAVDLLRLIRVAPLAVLYGKSGLGKSSLLQAGVFPQLRGEHYLPVCVRVDFSDHAHCPPLEQVARRLEEEIARAGADCPAREAGEGLWQFLHRRDLEIWSADNFLLTPVLVLDQFEELFSRGGSDRERIRAVFDDLADLIENRIPAELAGVLCERERRARLDINAQPYRIVLSFREDFLPDLESWKDRVPSLLRNRLRLLPMSRAQAVAATERAGAAVLDAGVAARIVDFVAPGELEPAGEAPEVEPVLLSLCCTRLNRRRAAERRIDAKLVASAGGDILRDFFAEALEGMPEQVSNFIETYLIQGDRYRGSYPRDAALAEGHLSAAQLATLTDRHHLLRIDQQQGVARIELIHDRLVGIVRKARDERLAREREHQERKAWMQHGVLTVAVILLILLGVAGRSAWNAEQQASRATALRLAAEAESMFSGAQPEGGDRSLLQALAADGIAQGREDVRARLLGGWSLHREHTLIAMEDTVAPLAFTGDGAGVISSGPDHTLRVWDARSGQPTSMVFVGHRAWIWAVAVSPDGSRLVSGSEDKTLRVWDLRTGKELARAEHPYGVSAVAISADAGLVASASRDNSVRLWDARTGKPVGELAGHGAPVSALAFAPEGHLLVSGSGDGTLRLWDARTGNEVMPPMRAHAGGVSTVAFSPDGRRIVSGGADHSARIWDAATGAPLHELKGHADTVVSVAVSPDGSVIVSGGWDGSLRVWNADTGKPLGPAISAHRGGVMRVAFSPDGKLIASGGADKTLRLWDAELGQAHGARLDGAGLVQSAVVSPDGRLATSGAEDGSIRVWNAGTGELLMTLSEGQPGPASVLAFSADGRRIASAGKDGLVRVWEAGSGRLVVEVRSESASPVSSLALSPDGERLATGAGDKALRLWNATTGAPIGKPLEGHDGPVLSLAFSPDGQHIASGSADQTVRLWDAATGETVRILKGHRNPVLSLAFSPDGGRLVSGSEDATLRLWDAETGRALGVPLEGHLGGVTSVAFSGDGRYIASGSWDKTLRLWDAGTGQALGAPLVGHTDSVAGVGFGAEGRIISASKDGSLRWWPAPASWRQELCAKLTRNMSHRQWKAWVSADIDYECQCPGLPIASDDLDSKPEPALCPGVAARSMLP